MRIRILDRILVALAGLVLVAVCAGVVGQVFFGYDVTGFVSRVLAAESTARKAVIAAGAGVLLLLGLYCLLILFRHRKRKDKFILQRLESGELAISLDTLDSMVRKCLDQHSELTVDSIHLENQRDGLLIRIRGKAAGGISIPLTADVLQKQVKQYVTACSGVEVKGIRIQIEASGEDAKDAPFAIEAPGSVLLARGAETPAPERAPEVPAAETEAPREAPAESAAEPAAEEEKPSGNEAAAAAAAMAAAENLMKEIASGEEEDDRPIHQRLFSTQEEPCIMPLPPENLKESETEEEIPAEGGKNGQEPENSAEAAPEEEKGEEEK